MTRLSASLHRCLVASYSIHDLRQLCTSLGVPPDDVAVMGRTLSESATELILHCERRGSDDALIRQLIIDRPNQAEVIALADEVGFKGRGTLDFLPATSVMDRER